VPGSGKPDSSIRPTTVTGDTSHDPSLQATIEELWERRAELSPQSPPTTIAAIESVIGDLDAGKLRVAEKIGGEWFTHQWIKKAVLLSFRVRDNRIQEAGDIRFFDKVDTKFEGWTEEQFRQGGFRVVPGHHRPQGFVRRQKRRADAVLRQYRRLCR
jgi:2,3,4,5-tetrahydropyridine-2-carboxylate N-succinyltransferase